MPPDSDSNGRVTLAILQQDIKHLTRLLEAHLQDFVCEEKRLREVENRVTRIEERQGILAVGQATFSAIGAVIAGWFGSRS